MSRLGAKASLVIIIFLIQSCSDEKYPHELTMPFYDECGPVIENKHPSRDGLEIKVVRFSYEIPSMGNLEYWKPASGFIRISGNNKRTIELSANGIVSGCYPWGGVFEKIQNYNPVILSSETRRIEAKAGGPLYIYLSEDHSAVMYNPDLIK